MCCHICGRDAAVWLFPLFPDQLSYRRLGKSYIRHHELLLCETCREHWDAGDDATLAGRFGERFEIDLLRRAIASNVPAWYDDILPPGVTALREEGFVPIEELTGMTQVVDDWPAAHRRALPEIRPMWLDEGATQFWMVRAPEGNIRDYLNTAISTHASRN